MNLLPHHEIHGSVSVPDGSGNESEGMILAPCLPLLGKTSYRDAGHEVGVRNWLYYITACSNQ